MEKVKRRNYTFALTDIKQCKDIIWKLENHFCDYYAYILHDKDVKTDNTGELKDNHYHFYIEFANPRSLNQIAKELNIPPNMILFVHSKRGILDYLTHKKSPEKYQYNDDEVVSNFDVKQFQEIDYIQEARDYYSVRRGDMSWEDFLMSHNTHCATFHL